MGEGSKSATLHVIINNEKDPGDAAIVNAVKKYWNMGPYKFMSKAEFVDQKTNNKLPVGQFYLYEWLNGYEYMGLNSLQLTEMLNMTNTGYFHLSLTIPPEVSKNKKSESVPKTSQSLSLQFDLSSTMTSNKDKILDGYFDLMVKYFNNEIAFCRKGIAADSVKKENKDGYVYFGEGTSGIDKHDILLVKEQVNRVKPSDKEKKVTAVDAVAQFNPSPKNVYTVFPEDIKLALEKNDKKVLLYTNNMLINASDGSVYAAPGSFGVEPIKKDYGFWLASLGILAAAFVLAITVK
jgi:hypothetical protein